MDRDQKDTKSGLNELLTYFFRKKDPTNKVSINLKLMHGINKISIIIFIFAVILMITRYISRSW
jgi:hypothetical protein